MELIMRRFEESELSYFFDEEGVLWWPAKGICDVLAISEGKDAMPRLDEDERGRFKIQTRGGPQEVWCVNEFGLYNLILGSRKPEARAFKRWLIHDVLPEIRRTGGYQGRPQLPPVQRPVREHAEVSTHMIAAWSVLRQATEPLTNREIAQQAGIAARTARAHTRYFRQLGLLDVIEVFPRHLYRLADQAERRQIGYYQRLEEIRQIVQARQAF